MILAVETYRHRSIGTILRCASAFGAEEIIVVGSPQYSTHGAHGAQNHVPVTHFYYWQECIDYCSDRGCKVYSISPVALNKLPVASADSALVNSSNSESVDTHSFRGPACFIVSDRDGLTTEQVSYSEKVFHVEIPCQDYEEKVMYDAKVAICLQQYAITASASIGLTVRPHAKEKHLLGEVNTRRARTIKAGRMRARQSRFIQQQGEVGDDGDDNTQIGISCFMDEVT